MICSAQTVFVCLCFYAHVDPQSALYASAVQVLLILSAVGELKKERAEQSEAGRRRGGDERDEER